MNSSRTKCECGLYSDANYVTTPAKDVSNEGFFPTRGFLKADIYLFPLTNIVISLIFYKDDAFMYVALRLAYVVYIR